MHLKKQDLLCSYIGTIPKGSNYSSIKIHSSNKQKYSEYSNKELTLSYSAMVEDAVMIVVKNRECVCNRYLKFAHTSF